MNKSNRILLVILLLAVLSVLAWLVFQPREPEPVYQGKPLSYWLKGGMVLSPANGTIHPTANEAFGAMIKIGTNAIPTLLKMLRARDSQLKLKLFALAEKQRFIKIQFTRAQVLNMEAENGFRLLGARAKPALPELIKIYDQNISPLSQRAISGLFYGFGPEAKAAVPSLIRGLTSTDDFVRNEAINTLRQIRSDPNNVVPALTKSLHDSFALNRMDAAYALGAFGTNAIEAVPLLVAMSKDPAINSNSTPFYANVRSAVEFALQHIDPEAAAKAGVK